MEVFRGWTGDPEVAVYMMWNFHRSVAETKEWLSEEEAGAAKDGRCVWGFALKETGRLIGSGGLILNEDRQMFELGYCIMKEYRNRGLTTGAARAVIGFAVQRLGAYVFYARRDKDNAASGRVPEKPGFILLGNIDCQSLDGKRNIQGCEYTPRPGQGR